MDEGFRTFDHTADLGLEVWATTPERLFALAMVGVLAQVAESPASTPEVEVSFERAATDPAALLVEACNASLLEADVHGAVWTEANVTLHGTARLSARLCGPRRDARRQVFLREIKAVSHHGLELDLTPGRCRCRLILDV